MFGFVCSRLRCRAKRLLISEKGATTIETLRFLRTPFRTTTSSTSRRSFCAAVVDYSTHHKPNSFTVSYLINSCGLSEDKAIAVSRKVHFESSIKPDLVLNLLRDYEFDDNHISTIIPRFPFLLVAKAHRTVKPKLDFFKDSLGLSSHELTEFFSSNPDTFKVSLLKRIKPAIAFLKTLLSTQSQLITVIKRSSWVIQHDVHKLLAPNIAVLRAYGVHDRDISYLLVSSPRSLSICTRLSEIVKEAKKLKLDPSERAFIKAIAVLSCLSKSSLDAKIDIYKRWGWSEDEIHSAFRKSHRCLALSKKNIMCTMEFIVNKMGYDPSLVMQNPFLLSYSLEKRIIPRFSVIQDLITNGFVEQQCSPNAILRSTEDEFLRKFVTKYEQEIPGLLDTYRAKMVCFGSAD